MRSATWGSPGSLSRSPGRFGFFRRIRTVSLEVILGVSLAVVGTLLPAVAQGGDRLSTQWIYRVDEQNGPVAAFLDWNYTSVVFRAACLGHRVIEVRYFPGFVLPAKPVSMRIYLDEKAFALTDVKRLDGQLQPVLIGKLSVDAQFAKATARAQNVDFDVPAEEEEPFHTGSAEAFKQLVSRCG